MLSGKADAEEDDEPGSPRTRMSGGRFSQYLRFVNRRRNRRRREDIDPTDPYMPTAPEISEL
jgi:hypothetical protein